MAHKLVAAPQDVAEIASQLGNETRISIDTEFIRETTFYPKVALIQVATQTQTWLLDPTVLTPKDLEPIRDVMENPKILKYMHAAHADQECLYTRYGYVATPVLDTAVAGALLGLGDNLGLGKLMKDILGITLPKGRARVRWLTRPLPQELLDYAALDVAHLVDLGDQLCERLKKLNRLEWAIEESEIDTKGFDVTAEELSEKAAKSGHYDGTQLNVLTELFRWRENRARTADMPRGWVADNETVSALCKARPKSIEELKQFRGLNGREVDRSGKDILEAIRIGREKPPATVEKKRFGPWSEKDDHVLDLVGSYVAMLASKHEIATRFLMSSHTSHLLIRHINDDVAKWVEVGLLSEGGARLIGKDLEEFVRGKKALAVRGGQVEVIPL
jgi:ribonuclease D